MGLKKSIRNKLLAVVKPFPKARQKTRHAMIARRKSNYSKIKANTKTDPKTIIFESFMGRSYSDNPRALYEEMLDDPRFKDYNFIWALKQPERQVDILPILDRTTIVKYGSEAYYKAYAKAGIWVSNSRIPEYLQPEENQKYIQTWHGTTLKRLGYDIENVNNAMNSKEELREKYDVDAERYHSLISPSPYMTAIYKSMFDLKKHGKEDIIWEIGYPRNDKLVNTTKEQVESLKKSLHLPADKKIILYAPTWRDNQHTTGLGYTFETELDFDLAQKELGDDYIILFRAHYFVANSFNFDKYRGFVYDVSKVNDIRDLFLVSDMLITDYSSVFFDYAILKRPILFYMFDKALYQDNMRGFYFPLDDLPGPIAEKTGELIENIKKTKIADNYKEFMKKFNPLEDGKASERVLDIIVKESK